jgi:hypothetical protein
VGGAITQAGGISVNALAKWNGTNWSSLGAGTGNGLNGTLAVNALAVTSTGDLYAGGNFSRAGGRVSNRIAKWNGTAWSPIGTGNGVGTGDLVNDAVKAVAVAGNGEVYVGGSFTQAGGVEANRVAKWDGTNWNSLGTGANNGVDDAVYSLAVSNAGDVYVGGQFIQAGGLPANNIAKWNGLNWSSLGSGANNGVNGTVFALALLGASNVYIGGAFSQAGGLQANGVAKWNGSVWSSLGTSTNNGVNGAVVALAVAGNGDVYVGGSFSRAGAIVGGVVANGVAKWNGTAWSALGTGTGNGVNGAVNALAVAGSGDLYVGGAFNQAGGIRVNFVTRWNGTNWSPLGTGTTAGLSDNVNTLAVASNGDVYAGGLFVQAGGVAASRIAKWNGTVWSTLGTGTNYGVFSLAVGPGTKVYVGGVFDAVGDGSKVMFGFGVYDPSLVSSTASSVAQKASQTIYPNPAHNMATLVISPAGISRPISVIDALGREVRVLLLPAQSNKVIIDLHGLPVGAYIVRCGSATSRLLVE